MKTIIKTEKEDLLRLLNIALEKKQRRRAMNEVCHFDLMLYPFPNTYDETLYHLYVEYFTTSQNNEDYVEEICKIDFAINCFVLPNEESIEATSTMPIVIGLVGVDIQEIIDLVNKIDNEIVEMEINPIEVDGMLSYSIISIQDLFPALTY